MDKVNLRERLGHFLKDWIVRTDGELRGGDVPRESDVDELESILAAETRTLRARISELETRDSNVTFHSRNVMGVNQDLQKRLTEANAQVVDLKRQVTALQLAGGAALQKDRLLGRATHNETEASHATSPGKPGSTDSGDRGPGDSARGRGAADQPSGDGTGDVTGSAAPTLAPGCDYVVAACERARDSFVSSNHPGWEALDRLARELRRKQ